jgi:hypothetical protein
VRKMSTETIRYFTKTGLVEAAFAATRGRFNRQLKVSRVEELSDDLKYPVTRSMMVDDGATIRCWIALSEGIVVELDVTTERFNGLPVHVAAV